MSPARCDASWTKTPSSISFTDTRIASITVFTSAVRRALTRHAARAAYDAYVRRLRTRPEIVAECSHHNTFVELVRGGVGAALISDSMVAAIDTDGIAVR